MRTITLLQSNKLVFGNGCLEEFRIEILNKDHNNLLIITDQYVLPLINDKLEFLKNSGIKLFVDQSITSEPTIKDYKRLLDYAQSNNVECVVGIGGGSIMDVAKIIAAMVHNDQSIYDVIGIDNLNGRKLPLYCLPTTSGTGSEVSPNAILLDEAENLKKGVVSQYLVPDASYIDPLLTITVPPKVTAATGIDALTHCLEAYTNIIAHPVIDIYAKEGIKLVSENIYQTYLDGSNKEAREKLSLASLFGGLCLGPVNTAAVHALSYPLGGEFHIAHGLSNAVLLPYVFKFNIEANPKRHAEIALALGVPKGNTDLETAMAGVDRLFELNKQLNIPLKLSELKIPEDAIDRIAEGAMKVTRLLVNNPREITFKDAVNIYKEAY